MRSRAFLTAQNYPEKPIRFVAPYAPGGWAKAVTDSGANLD